jgi:exodeoxyribonuclease V alpha subunit
MEATQHKPTRELLEFVGRLKRLAWVAEGGGHRFCIIALQDGSSAKGECNPADLVIGCDYRFYGRFGKESKYGPTFNFVQMQQQAPHNREGVVQYLIKNAPGIGPVIASRLWDLYDVDAVKTLRLDPDKVFAECPGTNLEKLKDAAAILQAKVKTEATRIDLATLFDGKGFHSSLTEWCIQKFGINAGQIIRRDPFTLLVRKAPSCGFERCDRLYSELGLPRTRLKRQLMCLHRAIQEDRGGHVWHPIALAEATIRQKVGGGPDGAINWQRAMKLGIRSGWLTIRKDDAGGWWFALGHLAAAEQELSRHIVRLMTAEASFAWPNPWEIETLTTHQKEKLAACLTGPLALLCGTPGTGKTTTAAAVIQAFRGTTTAAAVIHAFREAIDSSLIAVVAPTGKAAVRIQASLQSLGLSVECSTVHRLLSPDPARNGRDGNGWEFHFNEHNPLPFKLIVVDEVSMLDMLTGNSLFQAIPDGCLVLLVGDPYQLPPVSEGAPLRDLLTAGLPQCELTEILRNSGSITQACRDIRNGIPLKPPGPINLATKQNWLHIESKSDAFALSKLQTLLKSVGGLKIDQRTKPLDAFDDTQALVALNDQGALSRTKLNKVLQALLNPHGFQIEGNDFRVGDKVICGSNCNLILTDELGRKQTFSGMEDPKDVFDDQEEDDIYLVDFVANGEIGRVVAVSKSDTIVRFDAPARHVSVPRGKGGDSGASKNGNFQLAPAITFHKSQGSQWPIVLCLIDRAANRMACRELWYTGISRAETLVVTIGELDVLNRQCQRVSLKDRKTFLAESIRRRLSERERTAPALGSQSS